MAVDNFGSIENIGIKFQFYDFTNFFLAFTNILFHNGSYTFRTNIRIAIWKNWTKTTTVNDSEKKSYSIQHTALKECSIVLWTKKWE